MDMRHARAEPTSSWCQKHFHPTRQLYCELQYSIAGGCAQLRYTELMMSTTRSAMVQMRVTPAVKYASEQVLRRIGMSMTEAMELFLRRMIIDQRIPFDVVAFDNATFTQLALDWEEESHTIIFKRTGRSRSSSRLAVRPKRE